MILTDMTGQTRLPRYFAAVFDQLKSVRHGRLDIRLPDGRVVRVEGDKPGSVGEGTIHDPDSF